jgi:hypothetical protein
VSDLQSGREIQRNKTAYQEFDRAFSYFCEVGWCKDLNSEINNFKILLSRLRNVSENMERVLGGFMKNEELREFLILHSVFKPDVQKNGEFVEKYMLNKLSVTDEEVSFFFRETVPGSILKKLKMFDPRPIFPEIYPYRVEFGCRYDPVTRSVSYNPINVIDLDWEDVGKEKVIVMVEFLSQYDDIIL